jgi:hypothetical protein
MKESLLALIDKCIFHTEEEIRLVLEPLGYIVEIGDNGISAHIFDQDGKKIASVISIPDHSVTKSKKKS